MSRETIDNRRTAFAGLTTPPPTAHAGLWIDRFAPDLETAGAKTKHLETLFPLGANGKRESRAVSPLYPAFFERWKRQILSLPPVTITAKATVRGRLAVGLGQESVLETSIALHRTYGVPYLPGSALKGLAAHAAREQLVPRWKPEDEDGPYNVVFGRLEEAGFVTFHDALWIPPTGEDRDDPRLPLDLDVMTVHHADYYGDGKTPPADWDDPNPIPFLTARGSYLLALTGPPGWIERALEILTGALEKDGLGAKTAAGYGRMGVRPEEAAGR